MVGMVVNSEDEAFNLYNSYAINLTEVLTSGRTISGICAGAPEVEEALSEVSADDCEDDSIDCEEGSVDCEEDPVNCVEGEGIGLGCGGCIEVGCATKCVVVERIGEASGVWNRVVGEQELQVGDEMDSVLERPEGGRTEVS
ncbi:hypothetical protein U1Q18_016572 [Sarracenia purpurea var. burkii]